MERHKKDKKHRQRAPRVPIQTYRWEEVRRSRLKGGYPWTYLDKDPLDEEDSDTMEDMPKSRSALTLERSSLNIHEVSNGEESDEPSRYIVITDIPSDSDIHSKPESRASFHIEETTTDETDEVLNLESADSSDNVSQYLDKEEVLVGQPGPSLEDSHQERAQSEQPKRKRKLSIDSSYSRKSLSKLAIMKKLKEVKDKIKVPKFSLPNLKGESSKAKEEAPKPKVEDKKVKKVNKNEKPVYIHIPLKPPEGSTDEFSYLEFGEKKPEVVEAPTTNGVKKEVEKEEVVLAENPLALVDNDERCDSEIVAIEILKSESIDLDHAADHGIDVTNGDYFIIKPDPEAGNTDDVIIIMSGAEETSSSKSINTQKSLSRQSSKKSRAKSAEPERKRKLSIESSKSLSKLGFMKKLRDAKEKLKFPKLSLSRTSSKKRKPVSRSSSKRSKSEEPKPKDTKITAPASLGKPAEYIHIPLKLPPGETDEFSHLEFEERRRMEENTPKEEPVNDEQISLESPQTEDVQMIFLTAPSDDEILDAEVPDTPSSENKNFFESPIDELKKIAKGAVDEVSPTKVLEPVSEECEKASIAEENIAPVVVDEEDGLKLTEQEQNIKSKESPEVAELKSSLKTDSPILKKKVSFKRRSRDDSKDGIYEDVQAPTEEVKTEESKAKLAVLGNSQSMSVDEEKSYLDEKMIKSTSLEEDYNRWSKLSDHDYEPVNPPPENVSPVVAPPPTVQVLDTEHNFQKPISSASSTTSLERRMLGGPEPEEPEEPSPTIQQMQTDIEDRFFTKAREPSPAKPEPQPEPAPPTKNLQQTLKMQTDKLKTKLSNIKKPHIKMPSKPNMDRFKIDTSKITLPTFRSSNPSKRNLKQTRQFSTESNAGGSKKNYFDFRTYPRMFKKKPKDDFSSSEGSRNGTGGAEFATVPRTNNTSKATQRENDRFGGSDSIRIPLHAQESTDREDSVERRMASHMRYEEDIDIDDAFQKENQEIHKASQFSHDYNSRWNHGSFHPEPIVGNRQVTDLDSPDDAPQPHESFDTNNSKDIHSSESSLGVHRRGVLEEIDSDEFFLRQKGISQDNIEVGKYLSSEIREAFKSPTNALSDMQTYPRDFSYDVRTSNQSLPETPTKRKPIKKPKRKKTPHVSQEQISFDQDSELDQIEPPSRPKRRSKRNKKVKEAEHIIPYQETIPLDNDNDEVFDDLEDLKRAHEEYEKREMERREAELYGRYAYDSDEEIVKEKSEEPAPPPRRNKSLKSLNFSEHDSILGDFPDDLDQQIASYQMEHEYITPVSERIPSKPPRTTSRSSIKSRDLESSIIGEAPMRPPRTRSESRNRSRAESIVSEEPCVEELCCQETRDYMGYATIDKNVKREPPLPPPRTPPRRRRSINSTQSTSSEARFFTVPRSVNDGPPVRPLRNYSTLGPSRPPRRKAPINMTDEEKVVDISQYIEIEDEHSRDLNSGAVISKMRDRPLPAPPRPPRKPRSLLDGEEGVDDDISQTQTEPLPEDFDEEIVEHEEKPSSNAVTIERRLITPTHYSFEETVTHGSLVVQPLDGARILPDSELIHERTIPVVKDYDDETSEIPEEFWKLKDPEPQQQVQPQPQVIERIIERPVRVLPDSTSEVEVLKAQKLQVADLDVDRLSVNELMASKIIVSEIDSGSIQANEIQSRSGALRLGEIELPPSVVQQLFDKLQLVAQQQSKSEDPGQKKTPIEEVESPQRPPRRSEESPEANIEVVPERIESVEEVRAPPPPLRSDSSIEQPQRPPRQKVEEPEVDDVPPRPPQPPLDYVPSQPPASFYALRAQQYVDGVDGDIPVVPRRRRPQKTLPESSSEESVARTPSRRRVRSPEAPSIPQLTGQLAQACGGAASNALKRLITHITSNVMRNSDGRQDLHVVVVLLLILIAGLILLGFGGGRTVHHHHWEYFNPPRDM